MWGRRTAYDQTSANEAEPSMNERTSRADEPHKHGGGRDKVSFYDNHDQLCCHLFDFLEADN